MWIVLFWLGCSPTCEQVCSKLTDCSNIELGMTNQLDCTNACLAQQEAIPDEDAESDSFANYKDCVVQETCEQIEAGVCYDSDLYSWQRYKLRV